MQGMRADGQQRGLIHCAAWAWMEVVSPCPKTANLDQCRPVGLEIQNRRSNICVLTAHVTTEMFQKRED